MPLHNGGTSSNATLDIEIGSSFRPPYFCSVPNRAISVQCRSQVLAVSIFPATISVTCFVAVSSQSSTSHLIASTSRLRGNRGAFGKHFSYAKPHQTARRTFKCGRSALPSSSPSWRDSLHSSLSTTTSRSISGLHHAFVAQSLQRSNSKGNTETDQIGGRGQADQHAGAHLGQFVKERAVNN